jgi:uncharacterized repeat protein (TIGR01451 family)
MKLLAGMCIFSASLVMAPAVWAQRADVTSTLVAQRVDTVDGKVVLRPAAQGKPGDVIEYSTTYRNGGTAVVAKLLATVPVPAGTTLIAGSAVPAVAQASTDGVRFSPIPLTRQVKLASGAERAEPVPLAEYRALRWDVGTLAAGASAVVSMRVRIDVPEPVASGKP